MADSSSTWDHLVAACLLRSPDFARTVGPMILQCRGRCFGDLFVRDLVVYGAEYHRDTGRLLPPQALKADVQRFTSEGASSFNYDRAVDEIWEIPERTVEESKALVRDRIVPEVQARLLLREDLHGRCKPGAPLEGLWKRLEEIKGLEVSEDAGEPKRLSETLLEALRDPPRGVPTGLSALDGALSARGIAPGETLLLFGRWNIGKSILLHHVVRHSVKADFLTLLWSFETGRKQTEMRLAKGFLGMQDEELRSVPEERQPEVVKRVDLPLYVEYSPPGTVTKAEIHRRLDKIEARERRKVDLIALDYSEKRARGRDWNQVADAYQELREICGERGMAGVDVAQENAYGDISYQNLLKDADVAVQLTTVPPSEWRMTLKKIRDGRQVPDPIPTIGPIWGEITRAREGKVGVIFELWTDRSTGVVKPRERSKEE